MRQCWSSSGGHRCGDKSEGLDLMPAKHNQQRRDQKGKKRRGGGGRRRKKGHEVAQPGATFTSVPTGPPSWAGVQFLVPRGEAQREKTSPLNSGKKANSQLDSELGGQARGGRGRWTLGTYVKHLLRVR